MMSNKGPPKTKMMSNKGPPKTKMMSNKGHKTDDECRCLGRVSRHYNNLTTDQKIAYPHHIALVFIAITRHIAPVFITITHHIAPVFIAIIRHIGSKDRKLCLGKKL